MDCVICRYGELALKGKNRGLFESRLVSNIKDCLRQNNISGRVEKIYGRMFVFTDDTKALSILKDVFGLVSISPAVSVENSIENISSAVLKYIGNLKPEGKSFRITASRTNKDFPSRSQELAVSLGSDVVDRFNLKVDLHNPDLEIGVEVHNKTFIFHEKIACFGGLPLGITGKVACLLRNENDIAAAWLMMRRGCAVFPVAFNNLDYSLLERYAYGQALSLSLFRDLHEVSVFAAKNRCKAFVIGDTLKDFGKSDYSAVGLPLLTPLIAYTDEELLSLIVKIRGC